MHLAALPTPVLIKKECIRDGKDLISNAFIRKNALCDGHPSTVRFVRTVAAIPFSPPVAQPSDSKRTRDRVRSQFIGPRSTGIAPVWAMGIDAKKKEKQKTNAISSVWFWCTYLHSDRWGTVFFLFALLFIYFFYKFTSSAGWLAVCSLSLRFSFFLFRFNIY